ncbi:MAG: hypothetical protein K2M12_06150 [Muribaculaceae bacterium]|nr:hypothetical protein [Muribaculaceae bacterium]
MGRRIIIATGIVALLGAGACNTSGCLDNQSSLPLAEFRSSSTGKQISVDSLEVVGVDAPDGDVLSPARPAKSQLYLPMRSTRSSTSWQFIYRQKALDYPEFIDIVTFDYESIPYFASEECGASYRYRVTRVDHTTHLIDSVRMVDSLITNVDQVSILIYFRTGEAPDEEAGSR